ncbi:MAG: isocitrate lyase/phosphoenolpyruvate mutase family protein [Bacteroidetes bacterium]|nr:isocitrate lyase/phosphoenolpyruvate mutase family protein [Bacteroidota bacterium]
MNNTSQQKKAENFLALHKQDKLLVLPNIWNPIGARILEARGFPAAATASAAISSSLGYIDGEKIKLSTHLDIIERIVKSVDIPVTADIESGYASDIKILRDSINKVIDTGVAGINIEDSMEEEGLLRNIEEQCERISTVREVAEERGLHLVINARIDCFLSGNDKPATEVIAQVIKRAGEYLNAGADLVYPIGVLELETITTLRKEISSPINILGSHRTIQLKTMQDIGINRVTFGPFVLRSSLKKFVNIIDELGSLGSYECFSKDTFSFDETLKFLRDEKE